MQKILLALTFIGLFGATLLLSDARATTDQLNPVLYDRLEQCNFQVAGPQAGPAIADTPAWLAAIYHKTGLCPLWVTQEGPGAKAGILLAALRDAGADGLVPEDYQTARILSLWNVRSAEELITLDTLLTRAFVMYTHDALIGRVGRIKKNTSFPDTPDYDAPGLIQAAISSPDMKQFLADLFPRHPYYRNLRAALPRYRGLADAGGWPQITTGRSIHPGEQDARIPTIRQRLEIEGYISSTPTRDFHYDPELVMAVTGFQQRHGLSPDGIIGKATIAAMNVSADQKVGQIVINLERWRWEAHDLGRRYVLVDIAGFILEVIEDDVPLLTMPVVVGTQQHETPVFSDRIRYIEVHPYWQVPAKIARDEMLLELQKNPRYLTKNHIRLFSDRTAEATELDPLAINWKRVTPQQMGRFKLRQDPGKWNALGTLKFAFPNLHNVYIHDTPAQSYFQRSSRAFSHGCIRASQPRKLALLLLGGPENGWTPERLDALIAEEKRTILRLPEPVPVHITYQTVRSDHQGMVSFHADIYQRDQQLADLLQVK